MIITKCCDKALKGAWCDTHGFKEDKIKHNNFMMVGRTIKCGSCYPKEFPDCKELEKKYKTWKCDCTCHDKTMKTSDNTNSITKSLGIDYFKAYRDGVTDALESINYDLVEKFERIHSVDYNDALDQWSDIKEKIYLKLLK